MPIRYFLRGWCSAHSSILRFLALAPLLLTVQSVAAQTFITLYSFNSASGPPLVDGGEPQAGVVRDAAGNLYGTTFFGGTGTGCDLFYYGCGVVFEVDANGTETVLHSFGGSQDGWNPTGPLVLDAEGNLYGTTALGGAQGFGVVFKLDSTDNETILHNFARGSDGANPNSGLVQDSAGNLYGTTQYGGRGDYGHGNGTIFEISAAGQETVIYRFAGDLGGDSPMGGVVLDSSGNIYGTTWLGGLYGYGTVFRINSSGHETVLHSFSGGSDGANPLSGPVLDQAGNLYGSTSAGGPSGFGTIYSVNTAGNESTLYSFVGGMDGAYPYSNLGNNLLDSTIGQVDYSGSGGAR